MSTACALVVLCAPAFSQELIERTLAIVDGLVITLSDARAAIAFHLVEPEPGQPELEGVVSSLIDRALMLQEVQHYAPPPPSEQAVDDRVSLARARFPDQAAFEAALAATGFTAERLRSWIRDDLRVTAYLDQRFAAAGVPMDPEITAYYQEHQSEFEQGGVSYEEAIPLIRERLAGERRRELITDWLSDLRRRAEVIRISEPPPTGRSLRSALSGRRPPAARPR